MIIHFSKYKAYTDYETCLPKFIGVDLKDRKRSKDLMLILDLS